jgi:tetratricopeptide (TPR) repeat protein
MRKTISSLVLAVAIIVLGVILAKDYLPLSGRGKQVDIGGRVSKANPASKTTHPRVEAHRLLEQKTPAALIYEWIPYYYRHPRPHETVEVIEVLLSQEDVKLGGMGALDHFFATILHKNKEELQRLKAASRRYSGSKLETLIAVINEAEHYVAVREIAPWSLESLWAEYMATGEKGIITRMIQALEPSKSHDDPQFLQAIEHSFYKHLPLFADAYITFHKTSENAPEAIGAKLEEMKKVIKHTFFDPAHAHLNRADNHFKQQEYDLALDEFEKSLTYCLDYQYVFTNVANMYEEQRKLQEAFAAMEKAAQIDPTNSTACYGMGRHCFLQRKYDEAIYWYSEALKGSPKDHLLVHAIARSYQSKGDTANAVNYFLQYLEIAPDGEHVDLVKGYLASVKVSVEESKSVFETFKKKDYAALENQLTVILKERKKGKDGGSMLGSAYAQLYQTTDAQYSMEKWLANFEHWLKSNPASHFANAAIGMFYIDYAWHARGDSWGTTITKEGSRLYKERLLKARDFLEKAYTADPSDPIVPSCLITVATGLGLGYAEMEKQFQRAIQANRSNFDAYSTKLEYLKPKWHGSKDLMFSFARETVRNAPPDSMAPLVLARAHWEMYDRSEDKNYFKRPEVWNEVKAVYIMLCQRFPESNERHNWFAITAYLAGDFATAKQELAIIKDDWSRSVWSSEAAFTKAKEEILASEAARP